MTRIVSTLLTSVMLASLVITAIASRAAPAALACTGGLSLAYAADSSIIVLGDAIAVGDEINRAPTITPTVTFTATNTATRTSIFASGTPAPTPVSPPVGFLSQPRGPFPTPEGFTLAGYGVTLDVVRAYGGSQLDLPGPHAIIEIDHETRGSIEHELRLYEVGTALSNCRPGAFVPKYRLGARYLVFAGRDGEPQFGLFTAYRLRVEGNDVILSGPSVPFDEQNALYMTAAQYHRYFGGISAEVSEANDFARIDADRVPLASVLRLASEIRGVPLITPPETGTAGLLYHLSADN